jgi:hypothetical protein
MATYYVDTDVSGGTGDGSSWANANSTLSAGIADLPSPLTEDTTILCRSSSGTADSTAATIPSNLGSTYRLTIEAASTDVAEKTGINTSKYRFSMSSGFAIQNENGADLLTVDGIQFDGAGNAIYAGGWGTGSGSSIIIQNCYFETEGTPVTGYDSNTNVTIQSCVFNGVSTPSYAVQASDGTWDVYNCTITGYDLTLDDNSGSATVTVTNCAVFGNNDDFSSGTITVDHCASDDGDGTNSVSPSGSDWDNEFEDSANGDFTLLNTGNLYQGGTTITGGPATDIEGDSWGATPSIGADEYSAGATQSTVPHIMLAHNQFTGGL